MAEIVERKSGLPSHTAQNAEYFKPGHVYIAPPDHHLEVHDSHMRLTTGPRESGHRPAIDPLFRSAAHAYGDRLIGVILSGTLDDGSVGLRVVRRHGGVAIVQDPEEASFAGMPRSAINYARPQHVAGIEQIASLLVSLTQPGPEGGGEKVQMGDDDRGIDSRKDQPALGAEDQEGRPTGIACPECHGVLWESDDVESAKFRCRVGHAYSPESLLEAHSTGLEAALWAALRALQEQASLVRHLGEKAQRRGDPHTARRFMTRWQSADQHAKTLESMLLSRDQEAG
jgi:two-component system chemotaxis response regulator CheB